MRLQRLVARGFRNLADLDCELPAEGLALLGANGQGKTNLLEAIAYPVLFRSFRGATDQDVARVGGDGFHVEIAAAGDAALSVAATWTMAARRKRIAVGGEETARLAKAIGRWVAVAFLPEDVGLGSGPAIERRRYLDRLLSLMSRPYLAALTRYRAAVAQRNAALRQGRTALARGFDDPLARAGAPVVRGRLDWAAGASGRFAAELAELGEREALRLCYRGNPELADPEAWPAALEAAAARDQARSMTTVGPHRDDLALELAGRPLRIAGSTGQHRTAAVALKLLELESLAEARGSEPALLLDDVFAELDHQRQERLARRLLNGRGRQVFVTAPREDELPRELGMPVWRIAGGRVA
ncbi:MAG: DNA replication/repair protein RecF [Gemmatimonadales bacterium]